MRVLITGITGFVGSHMADYLIENVSDLEIFAIRRWRSRDDSIKHLYSPSTYGQDKQDNVQFIEADLLDRGSIYNAIYVSKPDIVYHFAAQSFPEASFLSPISTLTTNIIGTTNLLEELKLAKERNYCNPKIVSVSSSEVYGNPNEDEIPIKETNPIRPANPYSISKVGHDLMSQYYHKAYGMKIITTRMFSHEGARRGKEFALSSFARQIAKAEKLVGEQFIYHGNLDSTRTYAHIDDAISAYWVCSNSQKFGEVYNIGGDQTCTVGEALDKLIGMSTKKDLTKKLDKDRLRPTDITLQIPDTTKFRHEFAWTPIKNLTNVCEDLLDYWRKNI